MCIVVVEQLVGVKIFVVCAFHCKIYMIQLNLETYLVEISSDSHKESNQIICIN